MQSATARSSLSDAFAYSNKPRAAPATKSRVHIYPESGGSSGFAPGNTIHLVVPAGNRSEYLNTRQSYTEFRLNSLATDVNDNFALNNTAHGMFRSLKVPASGGAGGGVLENVEDYNALVQALIDTIDSETQLVLGGSTVEDTCSPSPAAPPASSAYRSCPASWAHCNRSTSRWALWPARTWCSSLHWAT
jgi:hypothetical protein